MAIYRNGPNGGLTGKFGSVIAYRLNGQDIIKGLPKKRKKKPSPREKANRAKFGQMQAWLKPLLDFLRVGFKGYAPTFQGFVAAKSYNSKHAFVQKEDGTWYIDPALALVSFGTIALPQSMNMERQNDKIVVTWSTDGHYDAIDMAMVLAYIPAIGLAECDLAAAKRFEGTASIKIPSDVAGHEVHVYLAFVAYDHSAQSNSYYLGTITA